MLVPGEIVLVVCCCWGRRVTDVLVPGEAYYRCVSAEGGVLPVFSCQGRHVIGVLVPGKAC